MAYPSADMSQLGPMPDYSLNIPQSQGMFGGGNNWKQQAILMALAGFMARRSPSVAGSILDMASQKDKLAQAQVERAQQFQDQIALHQANRQFDIDHAPPPDIQDRIDVLNKIDPTLGATYARNYAANGGGMGPLTLTDPTTGQEYARTQGAAASPPAEAIARLKANPNEASQFDEVFGPGAAAKALGGAGGNASGGFHY